MSYLEPLFFHLRQAGRGKYFYTKTEIERIIQRSLPEYLMNNSLSWYSNSIKALKQQYGVSIAEFSSSGEYIVFEVI